MMKLLPILIILAGVTTGVAGGLAYEIMRVNYPKLHSENEIFYLVETHLKRDTSEPEELPEVEFLAFNDPFIIPVIEEDALKALISLKIGMEVLPKDKSKLEHYKPKLRDLFLQIMFQHSHAGAFSGNYTESERLIALRRNLIQVVEENLDIELKDLLIKDVAWQHVS